MTRLLCLSTAAAASALAASASAVPVTLVNPNIDAPGDSNFVTNSPDPLPADAVTGYTTTVTAADFAFVGSNSDFVFRPNPDGTDSGADGVTNLLGNDVRVTTASANRFGVNTGDTVTFTLDGLLEGGTGDLVAGLDFFDGSGNLVNSETTSFSLAANTGTNDLSVFGVAGAEATSAGISVTATGGRTFRADNFRVDVTPVPEPAGLALLGLGAAATLRRR